jgi:general secretion pathway protein J
VHADRGFTLVEVLVALAIMAVLSALAWRGIDGIARSREASQAAVERTLRLQTALAQWDQDLQAVQDTSSVPALRFDGATLRLTRATPAGIQLVAWTLREGAWWRWAAPPATQTQPLQEAWLRSQQLIGSEPGTVRMLGGAESIQVHFFRGNGWSNAQSAGDASTVAPGSERAPDAVRLMLTVDGRALVRQTLLGPQYQ